MPPADGPQTWLVWLAAMTAEGKRQMGCKSGNSGGSSGSPRQRLESLAAFVTAIIGAASTWLALGFSVAWSAWEWLASGLAALVVTLGMSLGIWVYRHFWG